MLPFPESFFRDLLALPHERIPYEAGLRVAALRAGRSVLETDSSAFDFLEALERRVVDGRPTSRVPSQLVRRYSESTELAETRIENAIHECAFRGCTVEVVTVTYVEGDSTVTRHYVIAPDADLAEGFFLHVCELVTEVDREILVFESGGFRRDTRLFEAIQKGSLADLVLRGTLLDEIVADVKGFFESRELYERYRIPHKRGILLHGPPGNGKTHFLKGLLATLGVPCLYVKSLSDRYGNDNEALRRIFVRARAIAPCLIVLEDLDSLINDQNRSYFLNELDGFAENTGVAILATTNYPEKIDPAIIDRPSRFDRKYLFDLPTTDERLAYLQRWARGLEPELRPGESQLDRTAQKTRGFSYAYLKELTLTAMMTWVRSPRAGTMDSVLDEVLGTLKDQVQRGRSPTNGLGTRRVGLTPEA